MYESFSMNLFINMPIIDFIISKQRRQLTSAFVKVLPAELKASAKFSTCIILFSLTLRTKNSWSIPVKSLQFPSLSSVQSFPTTKISQNNPVLSNWTSCVIDWQHSLDKQWPKQKLNAGFSETLRLRASCQKHEYLLVAFFSTGCVPSPPGTLLLRLKHLLENRMLQPGLHQEWRQEVWVPLQRQCLRAAPRKGDRRKRAQMAFQSNWEEPIWPRSEP